MPTTTGKAQTLAFMRSLPARIEKRALRGAAQAAIDVISAEAAREVTSDRVRVALETNVRKREDVLVARLTVKDGFARSIANWLEYGTVGHFITVDPRDSGGRSISRTNEQVKAGTLVIGGTPVGRQVWHPGSEAHPFLRVSLDRKGAEALEAAQSFVNAQVPALRRGGGGE
ncbi:MAG: HK97 gp10 family phage protein [Sphingomonas phyllosphaerae]|uniref:HK97 gp10 family phage protein n=1 Tax=Sphingomonas phyllosphaerae TaxID=257003 RepID=UPI002FFCB314